MRFHAPERQRLSNGTPCYCDTEGRVIAALPSLNIRPSDSEADGQRWWHIGLFLITGISSSSNYQFKEITTSELEDFLSKWEEDPEEVLKEHFAYTFAPVSKRQAAAAVSPGTVKSLGELFDD